MKLPTSNLVRLHLDCRVPVLPVWGADGHMRQDAVLVFESEPRLLVRFLGRLAFVWAALTGRFKGAVVLRGDDGKRELPRVLLDWEAYSTLLLLARPQTIPAMTDCGNGQEEMGGAF